MKLNVDKGIPVEEKKPGESRTPSTAKDQLREQIKLQKDTISELRFEKADLETKFEHERARVDEMGRQVRSKDMLLMESRRNNAMLEGVITEFEGVVQSMKDEKTEKTERAKNEETEITKKNEIEKGTQPGPEMRVRSNEKVMKSGSKLMSDKLQRKRFESKSQKASPKPKDAKRPTYAILERYNSLVSENKSLKKQLVIQRVRESSERREKGKAKRAGADEKRQNRQGGRRKKKDWKKPIKKVQTSPTKAELKKQLLRKKREIRIFEKDEQQMKMEIEKLKKALEKIKKSLKESRKQNIDLNLKLLRRDQKSPANKRGFGLGKKRAKPEMENIEEGFFRRARKTPAQSKKKANVQKADSQLAKNAERAKPGDEVILDTPKPTLIRVNVCDLDSCGVSIPEKPTGMPDISKKNHWVKSGPSPHDSKLEKASREANLWSREAMSVKSSHLRIKFPESSSGPVRIRPSFNQHHSHSHSQPQSQLTGISLGLD